MQKEKRTRIFLVGFMGSGKTTVANHLARSLGFRFIDLDTEIERRSEQTVAEIFEARGEDRFRGLESEALRSVGTDRDIVVATGGGTLMRSENRDFIKSHGVSVWLDAPLEVMLERCLGGPDRPLLSTPEKMAPLLEKRVEDYRTADITIDTSRLSSEETALEIISRIESFG
jgi:shikimate kinase